MDSAVTSAEQTINLPESALDRIRSIEGVASAAPLALGTVEAAVCKRTIQTFQVIGVTTQRSRAHRSRPMRTGPRQPRWMPRSSMCRRYGA
jgi:hypothetical protein